jgi:sugar phosphate isomerase/epimerase
MQAAGHKPPYGFGLYLAAEAARTFAMDFAARQELKKALDEAGLVCWTANAFPYGGFHDTLVKQAAFSPDWRTAERLRFTLDVAKVLLDVAPDDGSPVSVSTCPLGYGQAAVDDPATIQHLQIVASTFTALSEASGRSLCLAIEPEPDGGFERVSQLAAWLSKRFTGEQLRHLGVCWDLCHSAVVGEDTQVVLASLKSTAVHLAKIQISSALQLKQQLTPARSQRLKQLTQDAYLHQVRGVDGQQRAFAFADVPDFLAATEHHDGQDLRVHCHVPVCQSDYGDGMQGTEWKAAVRLAQQAGYRDFELETYTLPGLPGDVLKGGSMVETMKSEMLACFSALQLDTPPV